MNCRTGTGKRAQIIWSPDGKIVGKLRYVDGMSDPNCQGSIILAKGKLWVSHPDSTKHREDMIVQESSNQGKTWSSGIEVNKGSAAYSQLVDLGGSKHFWASCTSRQGPHHFRRHVRSKRFHVPVPVPGYRIKKSYQVKSEAWL